jgi:Bacterial Ig domain
MHLVGGALMSLSALVLPMQDTTPPTVTGKLECPANVFVVTVDNPGDLTFAVEVTADGDPYASVTVGPGSVVEIPVAMDEVGDPADIVVTGDNDFPPTEFPVFPCPTRMDFSVTTPESTPLVIDLFGPCSWPTETTHGTLESTGSGELLYTPDAGFVGEDTFDYECGASVNSFGTVTITVTDASAPVAPVVEPAFTG